MVIRLLYGCSKATTLLFTTATAATSATRTTRITSTISPHANWPFRAIVEPASRGITTLQRSFSFWPCSTMMKKTKTMDPSRRRMAISSRSFSTTRSNMTTIASTQAEKTAEETNPDSTGATSSAQTTRKRVQSVGIKLFEEFKAKNDTTGMVKLITQLRSHGMTPTAFMYVTVINIFAEHGDVQGVQAWLDDFVSSNRPWTVAICRSIFAACLKAGHIDGLLLAYARMKEHPAIGQTLNHKTFLTIINALGKKGDFVNIRKILFEMRRDYGLEPNIYIYNALISCYGQHGHTEEAQKYYDEMTQTHNITPDAFTLSSLVEAYSTRGDTKNMIRWFNIITMKYSVQPNAIVFASFLDAFARQNDIQSMMQWYRDMKNVYKVQPHGSIYHILVGVHSRLGMLEQAEKYLKYLQRISTDKDQLCSAYTMLMDAFGRKGDTSNMVRVFDEMVLSGIQPDVIAYNTVISAYGRKFDIDPMLQWFRRLRDDTNVPKGGPMTDVYNAIIDTFCRRAVSPIHAKDSDISTAMAFVALMKDHGVPRDEITYSILIRMFVRKNIRDRAWRLFRQMITEGISPTRPMYNIILHAERMPASHLDGLLEEMRRGGLEPDVTTFNAFLWNLAKQGDIAGIEYVFERMINENVQPDTTTFQAMLRAYGRHYSRSLDTRSCERMTELLQTMKTDYGVEPDTSILNEFLHFFQRFQPGSELQMFEWMKQQPDPSKRPNQFSYDIIIDSYGRKGDLQTVRRLFEEMVELSREGRSPTLAPRTSTFNIIIKAYGHAGDILGMLSWFELMKASTTPHYQYQQQRHKSKRDNNSNNSNNTTHASNTAPNILTYATMLQALCRSNCTAAVDRLFSELLMLVATNQIKVPRDPSTASKVNSMFVSIVRSYQEMGGNPSNAAERMANMFSGDQSQQQSGHEAEHFGDDDIEFSDLEFEPTYAIR